MITLLKNWGIIKQTLYTNVSHELIGTLSMERTILQTTAIWRYIKTVSGQIRTILERRNSKKKKKNNN